MTTKKGQAAMEYLMTYGWAVLICIIVFTALVALGVFNPECWDGECFLYEEKPTTVCEDDGEINITIVGIGGLNELLQGMDIDASNVNITECWIWEEDQIYHNLLNNNTEFVMYEKGELMCEGTYRCGEDNQK